MRNLLIILALATALIGCDRQPLYSNLNEQQANEVEAALLSAGIEAGKLPVKKGEGFAVEVAQSNVPAAMRVLHERGLPRDPSNSLGQVFAKEGFISSPLEERARYLYALSQELESTLMEIDGVVLARVHIALPQRDLLSDERESASASVIIVERPGSLLSERETDFKAIVTDGVEGLDDVNRVTVKFFTRGNARDIAAIGPQAPKATGAAHVAAISAHTQAASPLLTVAVAMLGVVATVGGLLRWMELRRRRRRHIAASKASPSRS